MNLPVFRISEIDGGEWVISENEVWVEGVYTSPEAALFWVQENPDKLNKRWISQRPSALGLE